MSIFNRLVEYIKGSQQELKKVVWPTKKEVIRNTILVIIFSVGMAIFLGAVDYFFAKAVEVIVA